MSSILKRTSKASSTGGTDEDPEVGQERRDSKWFGSKLADNATEVEQIAERLELRRSQRIPVTFGARVRFLKDCRIIAKSKNYEYSRISKQDLLDYRARVYAEWDSGKGIFNGPVMRALSIKSDIECLVLILDRAVTMLENDAVDTGNWLYYRDFSFDFTRIVSRWPHMRSELGVAAMVIVLYYALTPVLFCVIMPSSNICQAPGFKGVVATFYFASTTISTVGYGDLTVDQNPSYRAFIGALYMLVSSVVAVVAFSAIASSTFSPLEDFFEQMFDRFNPKPEKDMFLHERIRRIRFVKLAGLAMEVLAFVLLGMFVSQLVIYLDDNPEEGTQWNWMTSFYWAVQSATTVGYGDLPQPSDLRYFKIFYLLIATALVGNALGKIGSLKLELDKIRREHAWDRRPITRRMLDEMQAYDHDDKVDQYEFLVSSLISLGHLDSEKIKPIMDKFRFYAGEKGYIAASDNIDDDPQDEDFQAEMEEDVIDQEV